MSRHEDILEAACQLMETQGYHATGVNQILETSGAPKGSMYYYFPEGKEGLTEQVVLSRGRSVAANIERLLAEKEDTAEAIRHFLLMVAGYVEAADYQSGGPITAIAMEVASTNERLNKACQEAFGLWQQAFAERLLKDGYPAAQADQLATLIVSAIEGATVLARTERSTGPFTAAAEQLAFLLQRANA